jgi:GAF domain-containing protein
MVERGPTNTALLAITREVADDRALAGLICQACVVGLSVDGAALSLLTATTSRHTLHATDPTAQLLEELQFTLNEGVCIEAATTGRPVFVDDIHQLGQVTRWPVFAAAVAEQTDVRALCALPLRWGSTNLGVLDLYRRRPVGLSDAQRADAMAAVDTAALMMLTLRTEPTTPTDPADLPDVADWGAAWLDPPIAARAEIHQATGMVLAQLDISATDALARMRAYAFAHQRLLVDVAADVVARRVSFTEERPRE